MTAERGPAVPLPAQPGRDARPIRRRRAGAGVARPRQRLLPLIQHGPGRGRHSSRTTRMAWPIPPGPGWSARCWSAGRSPAAWRSPGAPGGRRASPGRAPARADARSRRRPSFRSWRCWSPAATPCSPKCAGSATTRSSARRSTMPPARRSTRRPRCSACLIPAARRWPALARQRPTRRVSSSRGRCSTGPAWISASAV